MLLSEKQDWDSEFLAGASAGWGVGGEWMALFAFCSRLPTLLLLMHVNGSPVNHTLV